MKQRINNTIAIFLTIIFLGIMVMPTIILTVDDTADISSFYGMGEEEESEEFKLVLHLEDFKNEANEIISNIIPLNKHRVKTYSKPHLNLVSPPPEII